MKRTHQLILFVILLAFAASASADTLYWYYVDCDGVATFTDRDSVPQQYRGDAELKVGTGLFDYSKTTVDTFPFVAATQAPSPSTSSVAPPVVVIRSENPVEVNRYHAEDLYRP